VHPQARQGQEAPDVDRDFQPLIDQALAMEGFTTEVPELHTMTGFGHDAVLSVADTVVELVKEGKIRRFFLIGGCDGFEGERSYYRDLALGLPKVRRSPPHPHTPCFLRLLLATTYW